VTDDANGTVGDYPISTLFQWLRTHFFFLKKAHALVGNFVGIQAISPAPPLMDTLSLLKRLSINKVILLLQPLYWRVQTHGRPSFPGHSSRECIWPLPFVVLLLLPGWNRSQSAIRGINNRFRG
jgi:hypothetical protein